MLHNSHLFDSITIHREAILPWRRGAQRLCSHAVDVTWCRRRPMKSNNRRLRILRAPRSAMFYKTIAFASHLSGVGVLRSRRVKGILQLP